MTPQSLFFEGIEEAAKELARHYADPKDPKESGAKALAQRLRPNKSPTAAHSWWLDCCNVNRTEHNLTGEDWLALIKIGREIGCHAVLHFICDEADYQRAQPVEPEDERAALQREFIASVKLQQRLADRLERLERAETVAALREVRR